MAHTAQTADLTATAPRAIHGRIILSAVSEKQAEVEAVELVIVPNAVPMKIGLERMHVYAVIMGIDCLRFAIWILNASDGTTNATRSKSSSESVRLSAGVAQEEKEIGVRWKIVRLDII